MKDIKNIKDIKDKMDKKDKFVLLFHSSMGRKMIEEYSESNSKSIQIKQFKINPKPIRNPFKYNLME